MTAFIYDLLYALPAGAAATALCRNFTGREGILPMVVAAALELICVLFVHLRLRGRAILAGTIAVGISVLFITGEGISESFIWPAKILIICVICLLLHKAASNDLRIKAGIALICLVTLVILMITKTDVAPVAFFGIFFVIIASAAELIQAYWKKEGDTDARRHVVFMLPFIVALFIPFMCIDIPQKPYDWKIVKVIISDIRDGIETIAQTFAPWRSWDNGDCMGFSEQANIGGSLTGYPYKAITITSYGEDDHRMYLAGKSFDTFSGREWDKKDASDTDERSYDLLESVAAIMQQNPGNLRDHLQSVRMRIKYEGVRTRYAFLPPKSSPETSAELRQKGGDMQLLHGRSADYYVYHYRMNRSSDLVDRVLKEERPIDRKAFALAVQETRDIIKQEHSFDGYEEYISRIYDIYLPETKLSGRASEYMDELLDGAGCDYEKLIRIENALSGFRYTVTPGDLPETVRTQADFVDYLLFDKQEGYCSYFATAFVILARAQGIPARYVQGYSTLTSRRDYEVLSDRAHAWPEAYLDGVGWVIFEPTPGFVQSSGWEAAEHEDGSGGEPVHSVYMDHKTGPDEDGQGIIQDGQDHKDHGWITVLIISVAAFLLVFAVCDRMIRGYRYSKMTGRDKILVLSQKNIRLLKIAGIRIRDGETLREFAQRASSLIPKEHLEFTAIYEEALYGPHRSYENAVADMEKQRKELISFVICKRVRHLV